jgi:hypothetical protein
LRHEIIDDEAERILSGAHSDEINMPLPIADGEPPVPWWDLEADRCLLIGVFKHGMEKFFFWYFMIGIFVF